jgi:hypothetical protein
MIDAITPFVTVLRLTGFILPPLDFHLKTLITDARTLDNSARNACS